MLKKTITYTDYNDNERTEDFFFNFTPAELTEYQFKFPGGIEKKLKDIIDANDIKSILEIFKEIILLSYGVKSDDGKRFIKNDQLREEFSQCPAYSILYMELLDDEKAADFVNGIVPKDNQLSKEQLNQNMAEAADKLGVPKPEASPSVTEQPKETPVVDMPKPQPPING